MNSNSFNLMNKLSKEVIEDKKIMSKVKDWDKVNQFTPSDSEPFYLIIKNSTLTVSKGKHDAPLATLIATDQNLFEMFSAKLDPFKAFFAGQLKIEGDIRESQNLTLLLKKE